MPNHLNTGELYAFATVEGSCIVGKVIGVRPDSVDIYIYDRLFEPLSQKAAVVTALSTGQSPQGYRTNVSRRQFALMYPLFLSHKEVDGEEERGQFKSEINIAGKKMRFKRNRPYWEPVYVLLFTWFLIFILALAVCIPNAALPGSLILSLIGSTSIALPLGGTFALMSVVFRWIEGLRTGVSIRTNPTGEFSMKLPIDEVFSRCRDRLGEKTSRQFDFVDRRSGYIQARVQDHLLIRIMCYQIEDNVTGVITSCFDLKGGTFGNDMWALRNLLAKLKAEPGEEILERGPLVIGALMRRLFWFSMTAVFACVSAMFLKAAMQGEIACLPFLLLTAGLTCLAGFYLFRQAPEVKEPN